MVERVSLTLNGWLISQMLIQEKGVFLSHFVIFMTFIVTLETCSVMELVCFICTKWTDCILFPVFVLLQLTNGFMQKLNANIYASPCSSEIRIGYSQSWWNSESLNLVTLFAILTRNTSSNFSCQNSLKNQHVTDLSKMDNLRGLYWENDWQSA